jgi:hypothetical protein
MLPLQNTTPYPHAASLFFDPLGRPALVVLIKATLRLSTLALAAAQEPIHHADVLFPSGALRYPMDLCPDHPGTDVIVHGTAHAPHGLPHPTFTVSIRVADVTSRIRVSGPRTWRRTRKALAPTEPEPVETVALTHSHAFGGPGFDANPIGMGFLAPEADPVDTPLPLLEDDDHPIEHPGDRPPPATFGAIRTQWSPRREHAGEQQGACTLGLPPGLDARHFCAAPAKLRTKDPLVGGEPVDLHGLSRYGAIRTVVPRLPLRIHADRRPIRPQMDRLILEPDADRVIIAYRAALPLHDVGERAPQVRILDKQVLPRGEAA